MPSHGYSDLINHAFAYAAVHHAGATRKGTRVPYITHPANLAVILARYGCDDATIVAAILHDVVEDCDLPGHTVATHTHEILEKFGQEVLRDVLAVTKPTHDAGGWLLTSAQSKAGYLEQLAYASDRARWVCAADKLHNARAILSDLRRAAHPDDVWGRFNVPRAQTIAYYRAVLDRLRELGFRAPILGELRSAVEELERLALPPGGNG
ncbi:MAG TPA: HD domain-containing protein [Gemmatimonadaceae bacterium]|nr:HD domain-containing protein [Gemmatimonadaceae bacterium]